MAYTIQTFYPEAGLYLNTNHVSEDLDQLKELSTSKLFEGVKVRIINDNGDVEFEPPVYEQNTIPDASDIADMFNAPIIDLEDLRDI